MTLTPPPWVDLQSSIASDSDSCQTQATIHAIEMMTGNAQRFSPRALAVCAGIDPRVGGTLQQVINAINKYGLVPYDLWPDLADPWTNNQFFDPIPTAVLAQANKSYVVTITQPITYPFLVEVKPAATIAHLITQFNDTEIFDSYLPVVKPLSTWQPQAIVGKWGLSLKPKTMLPGYQVAGNPTVYIMVGNSLIPVADWQAFLNLGGTTQSIITVTQEWFNSMPVVYGDLFKTNS